YPRLLQAGCPLGRTGDRSIGRDKKQRIKGQEADHLPVFYGKHCTVSKMNVQPMCGY
ncbi:unnamed protein product, partial [Gulo gulo]